ncbi:MAG: hypothetical protein JXA25_13905 [Anaerolineales bacterium]|nr:hypothetical protein [Anaerolineales bacterium]
MSEDPNTIEERLYNMETRSAFRRQTTWQIYFPLAVFFLILIGLAVGYGLSGTGTFSAWADISLMLLSIPMLIIGLILLVLTAGLIYGVSWLLKALPQPAWQVQQVFSKIAKRVQTAADRITAPFIKVNAVPAVFRRGQKTGVVQATEGEKHE